MKRISSIALLAGILAVGIVPSALAVPMRATFDGTVSGTLPLYDTVLNDYAIGTSASFDVTFDSELALSLPVADPDLAPVSGSVRLGADEWILDAGRIVGYSNISGPLYTMQFTGTGPMNNSGGTFSGLFFELTPALNFPNLADSVAIGFGYPGNGGFTYFSYATLAGTFNLERTTPVPEPNVALLFLAGIALLWGARRVREPMRTAPRALIGDQIVC